MDTLGSIWSFGLGGQDLSVDTKTTYCFKGDTLQLRGHNLLRVVCRVRATG